MVFASRVNTGRAPNIKELFAFYFWYVPGTNHGKGLGFIKVFEHLLNYTMNTLSYNLLFFKQFKYTKPSTGSDNIFNLLRV